MRSLFSLITSYFELKRRQVIATLNIIAMTRHQSISLSLLSCRANLFSSLVHLISSERLLVCLLDLEIISSKEKIISANFDPNCSFLILPPLSLSVIRTHDCILQPKIASAVLTSKQTHLNRASQP